MNSEKMTVRDKMGEREGWQGFKEDKKRWGRESNQKTLYEHMKLSKNKTKQ